MKFLILALPLTFLYSVVLTEEPHCIYTGNFASKLIIDNHRNDSGHWITEVKLIHSNDGERGQSWNVVANQTTGYFKCENTESKVNKGFVAVNAVLFSVANKSEAVNGTTSTPVFVNVRMGVRSPIGRIRLSLTPLTWQEARRACTESGGELVDVTLLDTTYRYLQRALMLFNVDMAYVDLRRNAETQHEFRTLAGQSLKNISFASWAPGRPATKGPLAQDACGAMLKRRALLQDVFCGNPLPFFCNPRRIAPDS